MRFSPDGSYLFLGAGEAWSCLDLKEDALIGGLDNRGGPRKLGPDGRHVLLLRQDGTARLWELRTGKPAGQPLRDTGELRAAVFTPDGRLLLVLNETEQARFWCPLSGLPLGPPLPHRRVNAIAFTADGRACLTAGEDGLVRRWQVPAPLPGSVERLRRWATVHTALAPDDVGGLEPLTWQRRDELWRQLREEVGPEGE